MTNEEASIIVGNIPINDDECYSISEYQQAKAKAIKTLEQQACEDCISRQAVLDGVDRYIYKSQSTGTQDDFYSFAELVVKQLPSVTPQPKTGHWIIKEGKGQGYSIAGVKTWYIKIMCDKCGFINTAIEGHTGQYHYCPSCGARMEAENDE